MESLQPQSGGSVYLTGKFTESEVDAASTYMLDVEFNPHNAIYLRKNG